MKRNIILSDCVSKELDSFIEGLKKASKLDFFLLSSIANEGRKSRCLNMKRYFKYFAFPFRIFLQRKRYDVIVGWQQFYALLFCFYCCLFHVKKENKVIALNFTYMPKKGLVGKGYFAFMRKILTCEYLDYIHVPSKEYAVIIQKEFGFPLNQIIVAPFGIDDIYMKWKHSKVEQNFENGYILSIGRSNRDYEFLLNNWENIKIPLVIITDTYRTSSLSQNIFLLNDIKGERQYPWIANAKAIIIPIKEGHICSGDTVLLTAMSFERIVIVTRPSTLAEMYIKSEQNGLLIEKKKEELYKVIDNVVYKDTYIDLGKKARKYFIKNYSRESLGTNIGISIQQALDYSI